MADQVGSTGPSGPDAQIAGVAARIAIRIDKDLLIQDLTAAETLFRDRMRSVAQTINKELATGVNLDAFKTQLTQLAADRQRQLTDTRDVIKLLGTQNQSIAQIVKAQAVQTAALKEQLALEQKLATVDADRIRQMNQLAQAQTKANSASASNLLLGGAGGGVGVGNIAVGSFLGNFASQALLNGLSRVKEGFDDLVSRAIAFDKQFQTAQVRLQQFVGDTQQAATLTRQVIDLALNSPFQLDTLVNATGRLLAMGTAGRDVVGQVRALTAALSAVGGSDAAFQRIILDFGHIESSGTLQMRNLRALALNGIPVFSILQEKLGLTADQVQNIGRQGISAKEGLDALVRGLDERFGAGIILQLNTLQGATGQFSTSLNQVLRAASSPLALQVQKLLQDLSNLLQDPNTLIAANALGDSLGQMASSFRELLTGDTSSIINFIRELPQAIANVETKIIETQNILSRLPLIGSNNLSLAFNTNAELDRITNEIQQAADEQAKKGTNQIRLHLAVVAEAGEVQLDVAKAQVKTINQDTLDTKGFSQPLIDKFGEELGDGLSDSAVKGVNTFLAKLAKDTSSDSSAGRAMASISAQLGEVFIDELRKLGSDPTAQEVQDAVNELAKKLVIPGQFGASDTDKNIIKLAQDTLQLSVAQDDLTKATAAYNAEQTAATNASKQEQAGIDGLSAKIKTLTDARSKDHDAAQAQLQDLRNREDDVKTFISNMDNAFKAQQTTEQGIISSTKSEFDPIIAGLKEAHDEAAKILDDTETHQKAIAEAFSNVETSQNRVIRDLGDQKSLLESQFKDKIDAATDAEQKQARAIRDARRDLDEQLLAQQDIIDSINQKYDAEIRFQDATVNKDQRGLRAAQLEFDKQDLELAKQLADARKSGDTARIKALEQQRQDARNAFEESQDAARAQLQVDQDLAQSTKDKADAESEAARQAKEQIQQTGDKNIASLQRQDDKLSDTVQALNEERDTAVKAYTDKIRIANLFLTILQRTAENNDIINKKAVDAAKAQETSTKNALDDTQKREDAIVKAHQSNLDRIKTAQDAFDDAQGKIVAGIEAQIAVVTRADQAAQAAADAKIKPLEAELTNLKTIHTRNDDARTADGERAKALVTNAQTRANALQTEIDKLNQIATLQDTINANQQAQEGEAANAKPAGGAIVQADVNKQIEELIKAQPLPTQISIEGQIIAARNRAAQIFAETGDQDAAAKAFASIMKTIFDLVFKSGLSETIGKQEIANFLNPETTAPPPPVRVDPRLAELLTFINTGQGTAAEQILGDKTFFDALKLALVGTANQAPNAAAQQELAQALPKLLALEQSGQVKAGTTGALKALLAQVGITVGENGKLSVPSAAEAAANIQAAGADKFSTAVDKFSKAVDDDAQLRTGQTGANTPEASASRTDIEAFNSAVNQLLQATGGDNQLPVISQFLRDQAAAAISQDPGLFGTEGQQNAIEASRNAIRDRLKSTQDEAQFTQQILSFAEEWEFVFRKLKPSDDPAFLGKVQAGFENLVSTQQGRTQLEDSIKKWPALWDSLFKQLNLLQDQKLEPTLNGIIKDINSTGQKLPSNFGGTIGSPQSQKQVTDGVNTGIVAPTKAALGTLPDVGKAAGAGAVAGLLGAEGLGAAGAKAGPAIAGVTNDIDPTFQGAMTTVGEHAGSSGAVAVLGQKGLGSLGSAGGLKALNTITTIVSAALGAEFAAAGKASADAFNLNFSAELNAGLKAELGSVGATVRQAASVTNAAFSFGPSVSSAALPTIGQGGFGFPLAGGAGASPVNQGFKPGPGAFEPNHTGIDFKATKGEGVLAVADGVVAFAGWENGDSANHVIDGIPTQGVGFGLHVVILHMVNGRRFASVYGHLSKITVQKLQGVKQGQKIGEAGSTGFSTGTHLHFEIDAAIQASGEANTKTALNPSDFLPKGQGGDITQAQVPGGSGVSGASGLPDSSTADALTLLGLSGGVLGNVPATAADAARVALEATIQLVKEAGGNIQDVVDAVLSGSADIAQDKLKGLSDFAVSQMRTALAELKALADSLPGGLADLQILLSNEGIGNLAKPDKVSQLIAFFQQALASSGASGFADALRRQILGGSQETIADLANSVATTNADQRRLLDFIEREFGPNTKISDLAPLLAQNGSLVAANGVPIHTPDPGAKALAELVRQFALANEFIFPNAGRQGAPPVQDTQLTAFLETLKESTAKTVEEFLAQPAIQQLITNPKTDPAVLQLLELLQKQAANNPNITLSDVQGFLFGGPGFKPTDVVDAQNATTDAINTQTAVLSQILLGLDPSDPQSIEIWKDMLTEFEAQTPSIQQTAGATEQTAQNTGQTADATQQTATNTTPAPGDTGPGTGVPTPTTPKSDPALLAFLQSLIDSGQLFKPQQSLDIFVQELKDALIGPKTLQELITSGKLLSPGGGNIGIPEIGGPFPGGTFGQEPLPGQPPTSAAGGLNADQIKEAQLELAQAMERAQKALDAARAKGDKEAEQRAQAALRREGAQQDALNRAQAALSDQTKATEDALTPEQKLQNALKDEVKARQDLIKLLQQEGALFGGKPLSNPPADNGGGGNRTGGNTGGGGNGPRTQSVGRGDTFNIFEANNPHLVAAQIKSKQQWQLRQRGG